MHQIRNVIQAISSFLKEPNTITKRTEEVYMKKPKALFTLLLCAFILAVSFNPIQAKADAATYYITYQDLCGNDPHVDVYFYEPDSKDVRKYYYIEITDLKKIPKYNYKSFKSSNTKVCSLYRMGWNTFPSNYGNYEFYFAFEAVKEGTSKVSFQLGKKTYSLTINVSRKKYEPAKSIKLTGINNGKNLKSKFKKAKSTEIKVKAKKDIKNLKLNIEPEKDWIVSNIWVNVSSDDDRYSYSLQTTSILHNKSYKEIRKLSIGKLKKNESARIGIDFVNTKTHSIESRYIRIER